VEYGDYECPHCGAAQPIVNLVRRHFGPELRFVYRHFPMSTVHPNAEPAAETSEFAGANGLFWEMHDALFENQDRLGPPLLLALAGALGLSQTALQHALATGTFAPKVRKDFLSGIRSGVNGTPSFFINGRRHDGTYAFEDLVEAIGMHLRAVAAL
jgi:protein-disulfide isomerase